MFEGKSFMAPQLVWNRDTEIKNVPMLDQMAQE